MKSIINKVFGKTSSHKNKKEIPKKPVNMDASLAEQSGNNHLAEFQRRAYMGHFMAGPYAIMQPGIFNLNKKK